MEIVYLVLFSVISFGVGFYLGTKRTLKTLIEENNKGGNFLNKQKFKEWAHK